MKHHAARLFLAVMTAAVLSLSSGAQLAAQPALEICDDPDWPILPTGAESTRTLEVSESLAIAELSVFMNLTHEDPTAIDVMTISSPAGTTVVFHVGFPLFPSTAVHCFYTVTGRLPVFELSAHTFPGEYDCGGCAISTSLWTQGNLASFRGEDSAGTWTLTAVNTETVANLNRWCLLVYEAEAVTDLACNPSPAAADIAEISWTNTVTYDSVRVYRDDTPIADIAGTFTAGEKHTTTLDDPLPIPSVSSLSVRGVVSGIEGPPSDCDLYLPAAPLACVAGNLDSLGSGWSIGFVEFSDPVTIADMTVALEFTSNYSYGATISLHAESGIDLVLANSDHQFAENSSFSLLYWQAGPELLRHAIDTMHVVRPTGPGSFADFAGLTAGGAAGDSFALVAHSDLVFDAYELCIYDVPPPLPPVDALCKAGPTPGTIDVIWTNGADYDQIRIYVNGALASLETGGFAAGEVNSYEASVTGPLPYQTLVCVQGVLAGGGTSARACCSITVAIPPVDGLTCEADDDAGVVRASWTIPDSVGSYDSYNVYAGGALVDSIADGSTTSFEMPLAAPGAVTLGIQGIVGASAAARVQSCGATRLPTADVAACVTESSDLVTGFFESTVEISDALTIENVEVVAFLRPVSLARARIALSAPNGDAITLLEPGTASFEGAVLLHWSDGGILQSEVPAGGWASGTALRPDPLSSFAEIAGLNTLGTWKLSVQVDNDAFALEWWCLRINGCIVAPPRELICTATPDGDVGLSWINGGSYDELRIYQDGALLDTVPGTAASYTAPQVAAGRHHFEVGGYDTAAGCETRSNSCSVALGITSRCASPTEAVADGVVIVEMPDPVRIGSVDVVFEMLTETDAQWDVALSSPSGTEVQLHAGQGYGSFDLAWSDTPAARGNGPPFSCDACLIRPHPGSLASFAGEQGAGEWALRFTPHESAIATGRVDLFCLELLDACPVPPPTDVTCVVEGDDIVIEWTNLAASDHIRIERDGAQLVADLPGDTTRYVDVDPASGMHRYSVIAERDDLACERFSHFCEAAKNVIHFCNAADATIGGDMTTQTVISVTETAIAAELRVAVDVGHSFIPGLVIRLESPVGESIALYTGQTPTGGGTENMACIFSDDGAAQPPATYACDGCLIRPAGPGRLNELTIAGTAGDWALIIDGDSGQPDGLLDEWCMDFVGFCALAPARITACRSEQANGNPPVLIEWDASADADAIQVLRDRVVIADLDGAARAWSDDDIAVPGRYEYEVALVSHMLDCGTFSKPCSATPGRVDVCAGDPLSVPDDDLPRIATVSWPGKDYAADADDGDLDPTIASVEIAVDLATTWLGRFEIGIFSPDLTGVVLLDDTDQGFSEDLFVIFSEDGVEPVHAANHVCACLVRPSGPGRLADMTGESSLGEWSLVVRSRAEGVVRDWCVYVYPTEMPPPREFAGPFFRRGDIDGDGAVIPIVDVVRLLNWGFRYGAEPPCLAAADVNGDGGLSPIVDAIRLVAWGFTGGPAPPAPGPTTCDRDPDFPTTGGLTIVDAAAACATLTGHGAGCAP